jgi:hypothetical protein
MAYTKLINGVRVPLTEAETAMLLQQQELAASLATETLSSEVRAERNQLLSSCDWTQIADAPVDTDAWKIYRQALRDITTQEWFPTNIIWPTKPGSN